MSRQFIFDSPDGVFLAYTFSEYLKPRNTPNKEARKDYACPKDWTSCVPPRVHAHL